MTRWMLVVAALGVLAVTTAGAQTITTLSPALAVSTAHDDNVFSKPQGTSDFVTAVQPSLEIQTKSPTVNLQSLVSFDMQHSARRTTPTTLAARRHAMFDGRVQSTPSVLLGVTGLYDRTETASDLSFNSGVLLPRQRAQSIQATPSVAFRVTRLTTITSHYDWTHQTLLDSLGNDLHVAHVGVARRVSPHTTLTAGYSERLFVDEVETLRSHVGLAGWARELTSGTTLSLQAGPRFTSSGGVSPEVQAAFIRRRPGSQVLANYWRGDTMVLGVRGPVEVQRGTTSMTWTLRRRVDLGTTLGAFRTTALDAAATTLYHASLVGAWRREPYIVSVSYGIDLQRGDVGRGLPQDEPVHRHVFLVRLTVAPRLSRAFRPPVDIDQPPTVTTGVIP